MPDLGSVFCDSRKIMAPFASSPVIKRDDDEQLYRDTRPVQKHRFSLFPYTVQRRTACVSGHLMPVYPNPDLPGAISPDRKARIQKKSCFRFKASELVLLKEVAALTKHAFANYKESGFVQPAPVERLSALVTAASGNMEHR